MLNILSALLVGLLLGLLGGGGGIITVPTLLYGVGMGMRQAVAHTIPILGLVTLVQSILEWRAGRIRLKGAVAFSIASILGTFAGARISVLWVPESLLLLILIAVVIAAAIMMVKGALKPIGARQTLLSPDSAWKTPLMIVIGILTGILSGMVGVAGGFIMVPALSLIGGFPMTVAVGTNLAVIAVKSFFGTLGYVGEISWRFDIIFLFTVCGIAGSFAGARLRQSFSERALKISFAIFLVLVSVLMTIDRLL